MTTSSGCPSEELVARFVAGACDGAERARVQAHLDACAMCRVVVAGALASSEASRAERAERDAPLPGPTPGGGGAPPTDPPRTSFVERPVLARGTTVGRYVLLDHLGDGGMGTVHAAYDPVLGRRVALKILRPDLFGSGDQALLLREAKVLASLGHPNVLTIHDSGTFGDRVFLAMELVEGGTLKDWARATPRTWREIVAMMIGAGEGLLAAHRAGFVHRDFKPENVLVGTDGRPRVTDFGLALRVTGGLEDSAQIGLGTPLFMAPEQMTGGEVDARADIFAFFVTLHVLLYGVRPFEGRDLSSLRAAILANRVVAPPADRRVPTWLHAEVLRGLSARPDDRPPSMDVVLARLRADPSRRRARVAGVALFAVAAALVGVGADRVHAARAASCAREGELSDSAWGDARRRQLSASFDATGVRYARSTFERVAAALDAYAAGWSKMRVEACEATRVRHEAPEETMALRLACLDDRRRELEALVSVLAEVERDAVEQAPNAVNALSPVDACADVARLAGPTPRPRSPEVAARLDAALARVGEASAMIQLGRVKKGGDVVLAALDELRAIDHAPSLARGENAASVALLRRGRIAEAVQHSKAALVAAQRGHDDHELLIALGRLTQEVGLFAGSPEEGLFYARFASATAERVHADASALLGIRHYRSVVLSAAGRYDEAVEDARAVVTGWSEQYGPNNLWALEARSNLGMVLFNMGRLKEAAAELEATVRGFEAVLGPENPETLPARNNLGAVLVSLGRLDEAAPIIERMYANAREELGETGGSIAVYSTTFGELRVRQGRYDEGIALEEKAIALYGGVGADPSPLAEPLKLIGLAHLGAGRDRAALAALERALAIAQSRGLPPVDVAKVQFPLAQALRRLGRDPSRVKELAEAARAVWADAAKRWGGENADAAAEIDAFLAHGT